ncbi:tetratricopeptide repeat protein, partial [Candidatus Riflebacteria bacterium]
MKQSFYLFLLFQLLFVSVHTLLTGERNLLFAHISRGKALEEKRLVPIPDTKGKSKKQFFLDQGLHYFNLKKFHLAIDDLSVAILIDPYFSMAYVHRGWAHLTLGNVVNAMLDFNRAIALKDTSSKAYSGRGVAYLQLRFFEKALVDLEKAIEMDAKNHNNYNFKAKALSELGKYDKALLSLERAKELNPGNAFASHLSPYVKIRLKMYTEAIDAFFNAVLS